MDFIAPAIWTWCLTIWVEINWKSRANFDQALLICQRQEDRVDLNAVRDWCAREGGIFAFEELMGRLNEE